MYDDVPPRGNVRYGYPACSRSSSGCLCVRKDEPAESGYHDADCVRMMEDTMLEDRPMFSVPRGVHTRWASAENYDSQPGAGGQANFGRKGSACRGLAAGESFVMARETDLGTLRRFWITISDRSPEMLRGIVLRIYWDGQDTPAVEAPIGDFFCQPLGRLRAFQNAWFDNPEGRSFNCRIPMPFRRGFRMTATNESCKDLPMFFYDVNYTLGDDHGLDAGYFHACWRRENPTVLKKDFEILPFTEGRGRFLGCTLGVIADLQHYGRSWWGEGEVKMFIDGDGDLPTLCGTGTEDYIGTGWGQGQYSCMWHGCPLGDEERMQYGFYRLHGPDPVYFLKDIRVTIQQIGCMTEQQMLQFLEETGAELIATGDGTRKLTAAGLRAGQPCSIFERQDDWCATAYYYLDRPGGVQTPIAPYAERVAGLTGD